MKLVCHPDAWDDYVSWQADNRKVLQRINALIKDIQRSNDGGVGVVDSHGHIEILSCRHHYSDR